VTKSVLVVILAAALPSLTVGQTAVAGRAEDEKAVRNAIAGLVQSWNSHDMKSFAQLCAEDCDYVNISGTDEKGRAEIERHHTEIHAGKYKDSHLTASSVTVRFLRPDVALAHVGWEVLYGDGNKETSFQTLVLTKEGNHWLIAAAHNTLTSGPAPSQTIAPKQ
jgi:uncharacterized protein (TIGR02246 family)